ncbi:MAG: hypothetical protein E7C94_02585 [Finegoldia magna]|uniref:hypothetical protein n=1 Tax=Finegoldia magna TaxID=1260 RepID=UPI0029050C87|nr:hypothetical protein [Finegoldia magna]MDU2574797.1 hypothetical protein [Finegoldia magna]
MKVADLDSIYNFLTRIKDEKMEYDLAYKWLRNYQMLTDPIGAFEEQLIRLNDECKSDEKLEIGSYKLKEDKIDYYNEQLKKLYDTEINIDFIKFNRDNLKTLQLSMSDVDILERFFIIKEAKESEEE